MRCVCVATLQMSSPPPRTQSQKLGESRRWDLGEKWKPRGLWRVLWGGWEGGGWVSPGSGEEDPGESEIPPYSHFMSRPLTTRLPADRAPLTQFPL